ncbi:MAG: tetratricopeptide repeat protein [Polyangiaceae bacterium]|nr:tetratricopeptide repeat protein [Polyangiaceae bacterium]
MKMRAVFLGACAVVLVLGCSRHKQEAAKRFEEGQQTVKLDPGAAIKKYQEAAELDPTQHKYLKGLAEAYKKKEEWDKVVATMGKAVELAPTYANYWFLRGYAFEQLAKKAKGGQAYKDADEAYKKCIDADPNYDECRWRRGMVSLWLDQADSEQKALQYFTEAVDVRPDRIDYYQWPASLYLQLKYYKEAAQVLDAAKSVAKPNDPELFNVHQLLARVYQQDGKLDKAVEELRAAKALGAEDHPEILFNLGGALAKQGESHKTEAVQMLKDFCRRACKAKGAEKYKSECEQATDLAQQFGESCG